MLKECKPDEAEPKGTELNMRKFNNCVQAGHIYFHPGTRKPPILPAATLKAFVDAHPELPIVIESDRVVEVPHLVLACFLTSGGIGIKPSEDKVAVDERGRAIILLFTAAADNRGYYFDPSTHFKMGKQHNRMRIFNWTTVHFDDGGVSNSPRKAWKALYIKLLTMV